MNGENAALYRFTITIQTSNHRASVSCETCVEMPCLPPRELIHDAKIDDSLPKFPL